MLIGNHQEVGKVGREPETDRVAEECGQTTAIHSFCICHFSNRRNLLRIRFNHDNLQVALREKLLNHFAIACTPEEAVAVRIGQCFNHILKPCDGGIARAEISFCGRIECDDTRCAAIAEDLSLLRRYKESIIRCR